MPAPKRTPARKSKAPGRNIEDWQRKTERITLRLKPEVMQRLYSLSTEMSDEPGTAVSYAAVVTAALEALSREMDAEVEANEALGSVLQSSGAQEDDHG